ncbi:MAG: hypothetical protein KBT03_02805, partial [Bacteroidales bacterium]|nr:hypothetical protein [Candidatus Scybalousia scybalohippi]
GVDTLVYTAINDCYSDSTTYNAESRKTKILLNNEFSLNSGIPFLVKNGESITLDKNGGPDIYYSRIKIYGITY